MEVSQYMEMFIEESQEHLQVLNKCLLDLENDPSNIHLLDEIFRSAHTIKGMSATMGFSSIAELTHEMENILDLLRNEKLKATSNIIDILFQCVDMLGQLIENTDSDGDNHSIILPLLNELKNIAVNNSPVQQSAEDDIPKSNNLVMINKIPFNEPEKNLVFSALNQGINVFYVQISLSEGCLLKAVRVYMVLKSLDDIGEVIKCIPTTEELEKENFGSSFEIVLITDSTADSIMREILSISEISNVDVQTISLNNLNTDSNDDNEHLSATPTNVSTTKINSLDNEKKHKGGQSVRVDIERLDALLNLVGELVINKTRLEQLGLTHRLNDLTETIEQMDRVTTDLQNVVMKVRMVPVGQVFNRFPRMVRDLSHELHKEINLIIEGEDTELDRTVIDEIGDPIVHLLRNSIDHGIEHAQERQAMGKNPTGHIYLIAKHEGNNVVIEVKDDGRGIIPSNIRKAAVDKELMTQQDVDKLDDNEAVRLIFLPGFSTANTVTDVSGRGVGMDAVKTKIESLGGTIDVDTTPGNGSKFIIRLPLTLAIIQALLIRIANEIYAIPLASIDSTINVNISDIKTIQGQEVILLRGQIIPIIRLNKVLGTEQQSVEQLNDIFIVIVHIGDQRAGIIVDTLIGQQEIVIKSLGKLLSGIKTIAGATILGNGQVALILDVSYLMQLKSEV